MLGRAVVLLCAGILALGIHIGQASADGVFTLERGGDPDLFSVGAGVYAFRDPDRGAEGTIENRSALFQLDWLGGYKFLNLWDYFKVGPMVGGMVNTDGGLFGWAGIYGVGDLNRIFGWSMTFRPFFGIAANKRGGSRDLGGTFLFNSGATLAYVFGNEATLGLTFSHQSNGGLLNREGGANPGAANLLVTYAIPFRKLF